MELDDLIGPLPAPLGRWLLRRMVAGAVRYGHEFAILRVRGARAGRCSRSSCAAPTSSRTGSSATTSRCCPTRTASAPSAPRSGSAAETGALVGVACWSGDIAEDLIARATRDMAAPTNR